MEPNELNDSLEDSLAQVIASLPPALQKYLAEGNIERVALKLTQKYSLHVDQAGILEREMNLLLIGAEDPNEFAASLKSDANISDEVIKSILVDLNQEVFAPLQAQMRTAETAQAPVQTAPTVAQQRPIQPPPVAPVAPKPIQPSQPVSPIAQKAPTPPMVAADDNRPVPADESLMIYNGAPLPPKTILPNSGTPITSATKPAPKVVPLPANLPGTLPPPRIPINRLEGRIIPPSPPTPPPIPKPVTPSKPATPTPPAKPYTVDPYREIPTE